MTMFDDKYEDFDYQALFGLSDNDDLGIYFNESNSEFISEMLGDITRIETLLNALPFVVDYAVYTSTDMTIEAIAHDIVALR